MLVTFGGVRAVRRVRMRSRLRAFDIVTPRRRRVALPGGRVIPRTIATWVGARLGMHLPGQVGALAAHVDRAGLSGGASATELLGWKVLLVIPGLALGIVAVIQYGAVGLLLLAITTAVGWFGVDLALSRIRAMRQRAILRDLPTIMDLLVLSLEAGMGLDRAMRTVIREYRSPLASELQHVLHDFDLGISRAEAFQRMAARVGLDELRAICRALVQAEELGTSLVGVMQAQSHEVRLSRRRAAEAEALRAPVKMLFPLVIFILPTLFMLLLGPVGLRAGAALTGGQP
jgi:tight adherence protein C